MRRVLPDTNAISNLFIGDEKVFNYLAEAEKIFMSVFVLAELYAGFKGGNKEKQNRALLEDFIIKNAIEIINATMETAEIFAKIKNKLRTKGKTIPLNDVWIASHGIEYNATIISYDKHFSSVEGAHIWTY